MINTASGPVYVPDFLAPPPAPGMGAIAPGFAPGMAGAPAAPPPAPELTAPPVPSVTGGALPTEQSQAAPTPPPAAPDLAPVAIPQMTPKQVDKQNAARDAMARQQAAYNASPEGQIQQAGQEGQAALADKGQAIRDEAAATAAQGQEDAANAAQAVTDYAKIQQDTDAQAKAKQALYDQTHAQLDEMINKRAAMKIDDNRLWNDMGTGRKIGLGIAVAMTALGDALQHKSGPNAALQIIQQAIAKDVDSQLRERNSLTEDIGLKKDTLGEYAKELGSIEAARGAKMAELTQKAALMTRATAAKYQSPIAKAKGEQLAADLDASAAQMKAQTAQTVSNERYRQAELQNQQRQTDIAAGHLALAGKQFTEGQRQFNEQMGLEYTKLLKAGDAAGAAAVKAQQEAVNERGFWVPTGVDDKGNAKSEPLAQQDGTPYTPDKEATKELRPLRAATIDGVKTFDELRELRSKFDSDSQFANYLTTTAAGRKLIQKQAQLILDIHKASGVPRFTAELADISQKIITGGPDATSTKAILSEMDSGRDALVDALDANERGYGNYTGKPLREVAFPDLIKNKAPTTPEQAAFQAAMKFQGRDATAGDLGISDEDVAGKNFGEIDAMKRNALTADKGIAPAVQRTVDNLAALAASPDPKVSEANSAMLLELANKAVDPAVKAYAAQKLQAQPSLTDALNKAEAPEPRVR